MLDRHGVVQHPASPVDDGDVVALVIGHTAEVARTDQLHQMARVRAPHADLAFAGHVPDLNVALQVMVVVHEIMPETGR